jgi:hypothetical protein
MGIFNFSPVLLLALLGARRLAAKQGAMALFIISILASQYFFYACFFDPKGGVCWGPRYLASYLFLAVIPLAFVDFRGGLAKAAAVALFVAGMAVNLLGISQRSQEYDYIRIEDFGHFREYAPQINGCAKIFFTKLSTGENRYALAQFKPGAPGEIDTSQFDTYRGVNIWYWQTALRFHKPALRWLFAVFILYYAGLLVFTLRQLFRSEAAGRLDDSRPTPAA